MVWIDCLMDSDKDVLFILIEFLINVLMNLILVKLCLFFEVFLRSLDNVFILICFSFDNEVYEDKSVNEVLDKIFLNMV